MCPFSINFRNPENIFLQGRLNKRCITRRCTNPRVVEQEEKVVVAPAAKLVRVDDGDGGYLVQVNDFTIKVNFLNIIVSGLNV